jgi:hypothetical protein
MSGRAESACFLPSEFPVSAFYIPSPVLQEDVHEPRQIGGRLRAD